MNIDISVPPPPLPPLPTQTRDLPVLIGNIDNFQYRENWNSILEQDFFVPSVTLFQYSEKI